MILSRSLDDLVIDIGNVHHVENVITKIIGHHSPQDVKGQVGPGVAHVRVVVHGGAAVIPGHSLALLGHEHLLLPRQAVEQLQLDLTRVLWRLPGWLGALGHDDSSRC